MKVKICGIMDHKTAQVAVESGADALGFVFAKSKRKIEPEIAKEIIATLPSHIWKVGVFVNETKVKLEEIASYCQLDYLQLHGDETKEFAKGLCVPVIKSFGVTNEGDFARIHDFPSDYLLLDSPKGKYRGGNGVSFDWELLKRNQLRQKVILAGGLNEKNVEAAIQTANPFMVDVSSGVETNGIKDHEKIRRFIQKAKNSNWQRRMKDGSIYTTK